MIRAVRLGVIVLGFGLLPLYSQEKAPEEAPKYSEAFGKVYLEAVNALNQNDFAASLAKLDEADKLQPGVNETLNLRGALYFRMQKYDEAGAVFKKLVELEPKNPIPVFNLGEVYFFQKNYAESKKMFQRFLTAPSNDQDVLGSYKVFLCDLMLENTADITKTVNSLRPAPSNPFYYFANAAVAFKKGDKEGGRGFVKSAYSIYPEGLSALFAESFVVLEWLTREEVGQISAVDASALRSLSQDAPAGASPQASSMDDSLESMLPGLDGSKDKKKDKKE